MPACHVNMSLIPDSAYRRISNFFTKHSMLLLRPSVVFCSSVVHTAPMKPLPVYYDWQSSFSSSVCVFVYSFMPVDPPITWQQRREGQHQDVKCTTEDDASIAYFCHVVFREDSYKVKKNLQKDAEFPHHVFHVYPPLVVQNLLPFKIVLEAMVRGCGT